MSRLHKFTAMLAVLFLFMAGTSLLSAEQEREAPDSTAGEVRVYEVFGMGCPACQGGLTKLLQKVEGVLEAKANWKEQQIKITWKPDAEADDEQIFEAIRKANFTPGERVKQQDGKEKG